MKLHTLSRRTFCKLLSLGAAAGIGGAIPFMSTKTFASANTTPKSLIVYFPIQETQKKIAQFIQETLNCDSFEVKPAKPYPTDYDTLVNLAREEKNNHFRPELAGTIPNTGNYQTIFVGYPSWWGTMPMPLFTFFEQINCSGKTIVPFTTHEGSRLDKACATCKPFAPMQSFLTVLKPAAQEAQMQNKTFKHGLKQLISRNDTKKASSKTRSFSLSPKRIFPFCHIPVGRFAEHPLIFPIELRYTFISDTQRRHRSFFIFHKHKALRFV